MVQAPPVAEVPARPDAPTAATPPEPEPEPAHAAFEPEIGSQSFDRLDADDPADQIDLWERVRRGFGMADLQGKRVRSQERWYAARPDYVQRMTQRAGRYLFHIVQEVERRGLPTELALLPFIESAFNPQAMSSARASGMWQFIPSTGRNYDLKQNVFRDDRRDVLASTRAALDYLETLHAMFGDWHLALAAYNWGEGNVARAIARNRKARKTTDYASLRMPAETRHYVPKLQAVKNIVARPEAFGLSLPALADHPYFLSVSIESDIDVELAAKLSGLSVEDFHALNPQMNKPVILAAGTPQVLLPYDNANRFLQELARHRGRLASWTAWVAPKTLNPANAAQHVGMSETQLRKVNTIPRRMLIQAGSTLIVPRQDAGEADVSEHLADNGKMVLVPERARTRRISLKAGKGDSVTTLARRHGIEPAHLARWNRVSEATVFSAGQKVVAFVASQVARRGAAAPTSTRQSQGVKSGRPSASTSRSRASRK
ncbi:MAG: transglycosylase SLT domain-containing protein [Burkholderiaceae bacterium]